MLPARNAAASWLAVAPDVPALKVKPANVILLPAAKVAGNVAVNDS